MGKKCWFPGPFFHFIGYCFGSQKWSFFFLQANHQTESCVQKNQKARAGTPSSNVNVGSYRLTPAAALLRSWIHSMKIFWHIHQTSLMSSTMHYVCVISGGNSWHQICFTIALRWHVLYNRTQIRSWLSQLVFGLDKLPLSASWRKYSWLGTYLYHLVGEVFIHPGVWKPQ